MIKVTHKTQRNITVAGKLKWRLGRLFEAQEWFDPGFVGPFKRKCMHYDPTENVFRGTDCRSGSGRPLCQCKKYFFSWETLAYYFVEFGDSLSSVI